jgi:DNA invertase Pin-like site-specific DNA recombinase
MIYGYCRVSTKHQRITRQVTNILELFPEATIVKEFYTGTTQSRPKWDWLMKQLVPGDMVVFDSVSRMSRNAEEGFKDYKRLYEMGIILVFINEPLINTAIFESTKNNLLKISVQTGNEAVDAYFAGNVTLINNLLMALAEEQIKSAFLQSEKEVTDLHTRISQGMRESKKNGKNIGLAKGTKLVTQKSLQCKRIILKHAIDFGGTLSDAEVMALCKISRNSYYKYKRELKEEIGDGR